MVHAERQGVAQGAFDFGGVGVCKMDGRPRDLDLPPTTPLRPTQLGRGLPVPPVVAIVAVVGVFAGIAFGYGIAPKPGPLPSSSPTRATVSLVESPSPSVSPAPYVAPTAEPTPSGYELPPAGGLTLSEALAAANKYLANFPESLSIIGQNIQESAVIYARVERYGDHGSVADSPDEWLWVIAIRGSFQPAICRGPQPTPQPCPGPYTTAMIVLDYNTGAVLGTWSPALI